MNSKERNNVPQWRSTRSSLFSPTETNQVVFVLDIVMAAEYATSGRLLPWTPQDRCPRVDAENACTAVTKFAGGWCWVGTERAGIGAVRKGLRRARGDKTPEVNLAQRQQPNHRRSTNPEHTTMSVSDRNKSRYEAELSKLEAVN
jgi:hypothetical protein